jgi:hypothetical protein
MLRRGYVLENAFPEGNPFPLAYLPATGFVLECARLALSITISKGFPLASFQVEWKQ